MFALILSICMIHVNVHGQPIGNEICEQAEIAHYNTLKQCTIAMDRNIRATNRSVLAPFDWMYSCEKMKK